MRLAFIGALALGLASLASAVTTPAERVAESLRLAVPTRKVLLIPVDDRPATTQFAEMIGQIGSVQVVVPPTHMLGRFTSAGNPEAILGWMEGQDLSQYEAIVVSTDMLCYGSLIASRVPDTEYRIAIERLRRFQRMVRQAPQTRIYAFSAVMRIAPTAIRRTRPWREALSKYVTIEARHQRTPNAADQKELERLKAKIPEIELRRYQQTRDRNHRVQQELIRMTSVNVFRLLILGQDDAQPEGPHLREIERLETMATNLDLGERVLYCEGIDQHANALVSRSLSDQSGWKPRVRIVYSDDAGKQTVARYESRKVEDNVQAQIVASGAVEAMPGQPYDYTLFVNTPEPKPGPFAAFIRALQSEIDSGFPVAVADVDLGWSGTGNPDLFAALADENRAARLVSYAGWNTAGNTLGTTIPAANVYLMARRVESEPVRREMAQRTFLLHRLVNDFAYHRFTRPMAYALQDSRPESAREETYGSLFDELNDFVRKDMSGRIDETFREQFYGRRFRAGERTFEFVALEDVDIELPWPRAYEVRIEFELEAKEVSSKP